MIWAKHGEPKKGCELQSGLMAVKGLELKARPEVGLRWGCCSREGTWEQNEEGAFVPEGRDLCSHTLATLVCQLASVSLSQFPHLHIVRLWRGRLL